MSLYKVRVGYERDRLGTLVRKEVPYDQEKVTLGRGCVCSKESPKTNRSGPTMTDPTMGKERTRNCRARSDWGVFLRKSSTSPSQETWFQSSTVKRPSFGVLPRVIRCVIRRSYNTGLVWEKRKG